MTAQRVNFTVGRGEFNTNAPALSPPTHKFGSDEDTLAQISVDGYFNNALSVEITENKVRIGDFINITDSARISQIYRITALTPDVTVEAITGTALSHEIIAAALHTTVGGATTEPITVSGMLATDIAFVTMNDEGAVPVILESAAAANGQIDLTFSADPATDHILNYQVLRAI